MANKSYNEIVNTCILTSYSEEFTGKTSIWVEVWEDACHTYKALFSPDNPSIFPLTYFTLPNE